MDKIILALIGALGIGVVLVVLQGSLEQQRIDDAQEILTEQMLEIQSLTCGELTYHGHTIEEN